MTQQTIKCRFCGKYFFVVDQDHVCPFCDKDNNSNNFFDMFNDMFNGIQPT